MRTLLAGIVLLLIAGGAWYALTPRTDTSARAEADSFAANAVETLDQARTPQAASTTTTPAASTSVQTQAVAEVSPSPVKAITAKKITTATLHTNQGNITIEFFGKDAPNTVANFIKLASAGFYDGTKFHRVIKGFMIQGGDPLSKDDSMMERWGTGGPGYSFNDELRAGNNNSIGTISMANSGANTNGSQFFINVTNNNFLDGKHTTFGKITSGMDIVSKIETTPTGANNRPNTPIVITKVTLQ